MTFKIKRIYDPPAAADGARVLVDRLWPRGLKKADAHITSWMKDIAPSPSLRQWFGHEPDKFAEFKRRYTTELRKNPALSNLRKLGKDQTVTLLYGARDPEVNHAVVLLSLLRR
jgi:uncharacterized protein YeaO (DUF488 family)